METQFKDVAHLYIGCYVMVMPDNEIAELQGILNGMAYTSIRGAARGIDDVKPFLRPLSDCSKDENNYLYTEFDEDIYESKAEMCADVTRWFLSKRFDLFGFIESGQAIDATTLPHNPYKI